MELLCRRGVPPVCVLDSLNPSKQNHQNVLDSLIDAQNDDKIDHLKRAIGHMVRQIMEHLGYQRDRNSSIETSWIFSSGSTYRKQNWYKLRVFSNSANEAGADDLLLISSRRDLTQLRDWRINPMHWDLYRSCRMKHELEFILDADLSRAEWRTLIQHVAQFEFAIWSDNNVDFVGLTTR